MESEGQLIKLELTGLSGMMYILAHELRSFDRFGCLNTSLDHSIL